MKNVKEKIVQQLNLFIKTYDEVTKTIAKTRQRLQSLPGFEEDVNPDTLLDGDEKTPGWLTVKGRIVRAIEKVLKPWDVWDQWLKKVPGIGPVAAAKLIIWFNYKFIPICKKCGGDLYKTDPPPPARGEFICRECGKSAKGDGTLKFRIEERDFPTISKWWAFMGRHIVDGKMPKRESGIKSPWGSARRALGYLVRDQWNRYGEDHLYKAIWLNNKAKHEKNNPDWSKGHIHNAAGSEAWKLFLSHFWEVSRVLEGKPVSEPYVEKFLDHTNIYKPFYWEEPEVVVKPKRKLRAIEPLKSKMAVRPIEGQSPTNFVYGKPPLS